MSVAMLSGMLNTPFGQVLDQHPNLTALLRDLDPIRGASTVAGLLIRPELQSNCVRLEALVHLIIAVSQGRRKPTAKQIGRVFKQLGKTVYGPLEDPAEDLFVSLVSNSNGNYRLFEGIWESSAFYLQRILNVVEGMPQTGGYSEMRASVEALLRLSDKIADRQGLDRYRIGETIPVQEVPKRILERLGISED